jgi:hypothetical protein
MNPKTLHRLLLLAAFLLLASNSLNPASATPGHNPGTHLYGDLGSDGSHLNDNYSAGMRVALLGIGWDQYEPKNGGYNQAYISELRNKIKTMRQAGMMVMLDFGMQYPPKWVFDLPNSHFQDQYGDKFVYAASGDNGVNAVFNQVLRDIQRRYVDRVFDDLGTQFVAVRLGWGKYGELCFPVDQYMGHQNCYWAFDPIAQGMQPRLPPGILPCPARGWMPGAPSPNHRDSSAFLNWYLNSLKNYHDWQIRTVSEVYHGKLAMLYPSWGIRPGQVEAAIDDDLDGSSIAEKGGDTQRAVDYARLINGIANPNVIVYCTWIDAPTQSDNTDDRGGWSPVHYLAALAAANPNHLAVWGENTGSNDDAAMVRCFERIKAYHLLGIMWAFENQLYDANGRYATEAQYAELMAKYP